VIRSLRHLEAKGWPSYQRCVEDAPPARCGGLPDISRADFTFCLLAVDWGWGVKETAARLMQENGEAYALRTARNAAAAIERRGDGGGEDQGAAAPSLNSSRPDRRNGLLRQPTGSAPGPTSARADRPAQLPRPPGSRHPSPLRSRPGCHPRLSCRSLEAVMHYPRTSS
jgi:hypothetical protein